MTFIETFLNDLDTALQDYVLSVFNLLSPQISLLWTSMAIILVIFIGIRMSVKGDFDASDFVINLFKIVIILALTTQWANFSVFVYDLFTNLPSEIGELVISRDGATPTTLSAALGDHYDRLMEAGSRVLEGASWRDVGKFFVYFLIVCGAFLLSFIAIALLSLAKVATAIMLAIAPVFILLLMFKQTTNLFEGWLKALFNYSLLPLFVYLILAFALLMGDGILADLETASTGEFTGLLKATSNYLMFAFIAFILLLQATTMSANVGGGFALSTMNAAQRVKNMLNTSKRVGGATYRGGKATGSAVGRGAKMVTNSIKNAKRAR